MESEQTFSQTIQSERLNVSFSKNCGSLAKDEISVTAKIRFWFKRHKADFLIFKKLIHPKLIIKFLQIFTKDTQENFVKHFLKRCARTNPWEQSFKCS